MVARLLVEVVAMSPKQITQYLTLCQVPEGLHAQAIACIAEADKRS